MEELAERTRRNPSYSLNAFSAFLGISPASLSQVISGKRPLTKKTAIKIINRCGFSATDAQAFLVSAMGLESQAFEEAPVKESPNFRELEIDTFRIISDWYHLAILSLGDVKPNYSDPKWIAERLGIKERVAKEAFDRLVHLNLIKRRGKGYYQCTKPLWTPTKRSIEAIRKYHSQNLALAENVLRQESAPVEYFSSVTMAVDELQLPQARQLIKNFQNKLCRLVESGRRTRVYTLAVQLFPVSN